VRRLVLGENKYLALFSTGVYSIDVRAQRMVARSVSWRGQDAAREAKGASMANAQLKKGALELCVLALMARRDRYGYELAQTISEEIQISEGTVYPLLRRLTDDGCFSTYLAESQEGPPRKYYRLTASGRQRLDAQTSEWTRFCRGVDRILKGSVNDDEI